MHSGERMKAMKTKAYNEIGKEIEKASKTYNESPYGKNERVIERLYCYKKIYDLNNKIKQQTSINVR